MQNSNLACWQMPATVRLQLVPKCWGAGLTGCTGVVGTSSSSWSSCSRSANCCPSGSDLLLDVARALHRQLLLTTSYMQAVNSCPGPLAKGEDCILDEILSLQVHEPEAPRRCTLPTGFTSSKNNLLPQGTCRCKAPSAKPPVRVMLPRPR